MENPLRREWYRAYDEWLETTREYLEQHNFKDGLKGYPRIENRSVPWTPWERVGKPLSEAKVALVSTSGAYIEGEQEPFDAHNPHGDITYRTIPWSVDRSLIAIAHEHYDNSKVQQDLNAGMPMDRLLELQAEGLIGELSDPIYTCSGYAHDAWGIIDGMAKEIAYDLVEKRVDAALVVPI